MPEDWDLWKGFGLGLWPGCLVSAPPGFLDPCLLHGCSLNFQLPCGA